MKVAAITIENWKLPIFERHLKQAGYAFDSIKSPIQGMAVLTARHVNPASFRWVIKAAVVEAKKYGSAKVSNLNLLVGKLVSSGNTWAYHMTSKACLKNIQRFGLLPQLNTSGFGPMSKELYPLKKVPKIFFLRSLTNGSYAGFLKEWWRESPCAVLRMPITALQSPQESFDPDLARHEIWSLHAVPAQFIQFAELPRPKWIKLTDLRFE